MRNIDKLRCMEKEAREQAGRLEAAKVEILRLRKALRESEAGVGQIEGLLNAHYIQTALTYGQLTPEGEARLVLPGLPGLSLLEKYHCRIQVDEIGDTYTIVVTEK